MYKYTYECKKNSKGYTGMHVSLPFFSLYKEIPAVLTGYSRRLHAILTTSSRHRVSHAVLTPYMSRHKGRGDNKRKVPIELYI